MNSTSQTSRIVVVDVIVFAQMMFKRQYDSKHQFIFLKIEEYAHIRLHREYNISSTKRLDSKLSQQFVDPFRIVEKIDCLTYKLQISNHWRVHSIFSIIQLKSSSSLDVDWFKRKRLDYFDFVFVESDTSKIKSWELETIVNKREITNRDWEYLIRWKDYKLEENVWRNLSKLDNAMKLIREYENFIKETQFLLDRLAISSVEKQVVVLKKKILLKQDRTKTTII